MTDKIVWLDIETDKLDPVAAQPIQVACIATDRITLEEIDSIELKVNFREYHANLEALKRNHYDFDVWSKEALLPEKALETLTDFFAAYSTWKRTSRRSGNGYVTCEVGGHNIAIYDAIILANWYKRLDEFCPAAVWVTGPIDTMQWARAVEFARGERWDSGFSLKALCERFGIKLENEHDAMADVKATVELARVLKGMTSQ